MVRVSYRLDRDLVKRVRKQAAAEMRTQTAFLERALAAELDRVGTAQVGVDIPACP